MALKLGIGRGLNWKVPPELSLREDRSPSRDCLAFASKGLAFVDREGVFAARKVVEEGLREDGDAI